MVDDIVEWLSHTKNWLSHMRSGARRVDWLDRGRISSVGLRRADQLDRDTRNRLARSKACAGFDRRERGGLGHLVGWLDRWLGRLLQVMDWWIHHIVWWISSVCVYIYIYIHTLYIYFTLMLSIGIDLAQTQLVQSNHTTPNQLTQPDSHQLCHCINPRAPILGFQPFCSTTIAVAETALSHRQDPATRPSLWAC
jgi:hypothetical protein